jgi:hypothetical protein
MIQSNSSTKVIERYLKVVSLGRGVSLLAEHPNKFTAVRSIVAEAPLHVSLNDDNHTIVFRYDLPSPPDHLPAIQALQAAIDSIQVGCQNSILHTDKSLDSLEQRLIKKLGDVRNETHRADVVLGDGIAQVGKQIPNVRPLESRLNQQDDTIGAALARLAVLEADKARPSILTYVALGMSLVGLVTALIGVL